MFLCRLLDDRLVDKHLNNVQQTRSTSEARVHIHEPVKAKHPQHRANVQHTESSGSSYGVSAAGRQQCKRADRGGVHETFCEQVRQAQAAHEKQEVVVNGHILVFGHKNLTAPLSAAYVFTQRCIDEEGQQKSAVGTQKACSRCAPRILAHCQQQSLAGLRREPTRAAALRNRERVLFIGTQFSILYTSMYSPAGAASH